MPGLWAGLNTAKGRPQVSGVSGAKAAISQEGLTLRIERVTLTNFRCFGPSPVPIDLSPGLTAFIGGNGTGKTAVLQALSRLFGVTNEQRRVRRQDFHVPHDEDSPPTERTFSVEVLLDFPELRDSDGATADNKDSSAVPEFFHQMAVDDDGSLKCRLRFDSVWTDDGSTEGAVESRFQAIRTLEEDFAETQCSNVTSADRMRIQMVYVPSVRDGESQVGSFLRGRLWRAISWTDAFRSNVSESSGAINTAFGEQQGVEAVVGAIRDRWEGVVGASTGVSPRFRPVDQRFEELIRHIEVVFVPGEAHRPLELGEVGDGQRSLFHIALTLATVNIEMAIRSGNVEGFIADRLRLPALTLLALEEPENNLVPFFLSRIVDEVQQLTGDSLHAQAILSSHSASLLGRASPEDVRHFRLTAPERTSIVRAIDIPGGPADESKFVREAVRSYPELYFARFVILGEGASEEVVLPRIAEALGFHIDPSFVAVVPLGGRHVNHFWRLLRGLGIPHATLLDLDMGRAEGGWRRIKSACGQLLENGVGAEELFEGDLEDVDVDAALASFEERPLDDSIRDWVSHLREFGVYFADALDLDMLMLRSYPDSYQRLAAGQRGPREGGATEEVVAAVLGAGREPAPYTETTKALFPWYRYLFLGRSKPDTHLRVLSEMPLPALREGAPEVLVSLLGTVREALESGPKAPAVDAV